MYVSKLKIFLLSAILLVLNGCASGSALVTGTQRTALDISEVKLYLEAPVQYETIGLVKASSDAGLTKQASQDYAVEELKKQAAKIGANGVILTSTGEMTSSMLMTNSDGSFYILPVSTETVSGLAVFVE
ncbi:TPA: hypothetical protein RQK43_004553 [Vibrio vulnificus]|uniref:hypothetical protein n=1 Tax=Vibrio vulnificus TaxID=672 RepID=UPI0019D4AA83|nr:hypothetical protein [Vibrio vulnificus]ELY5145892.1 hypothetical protein [Vibrio vulnificus]MBN8147675.1 hypothetical protein [Vibrio vulnificus]MCA0781334.1 hypothetical protein [Vibrio vulnificus]MCU8317659.1 hypothetical protein [Vibrio vulnificus]NTJ39841.1 hypothetical protein [Vibrio vulnificus]